MNPRDMLGTALRPTGPRKVVGVLAALAVTVALTAFTLPSLLGPKDPTNLSYPTYIGAWITKSLGGEDIRTVTHLGARVRLRFTGTSLRFKAAPDRTIGGVKLDVSVDGGGYETVSWDQDDVTLAQGLTPGTHTADIYFAHGLGTGDYWANPEHGFSLKGIAVDEGARVEPWPTGNKKRLLAVGSSIAEFPAEGQGIYSSARIAWPQIVADRLGADCVNRAVGGNGTGIPEDYMAAGKLRPAPQRAYYWAAAGVPVNLKGFDYGVFALGRNDHYVFDTPTDEYKEGFREVLIQFKRDNPNAQVFIMGQWPWAPDRYDDVRKSLAKEFGAEFVDTSSWPQVAVPDGVHPSAHGHGTIASSFIATVETSD